jgi:hypothetical protein
MDVLNEFILAHRETNGGDYPLTRRIECNDGFHISVQANRGAYCEPRHTEGFPYRLVECGFPSEPVPSLHEWKDSSNSDDTQTVYGYVPVETVIALLNEHGGIKGPYEYPPEDPEEASVQTQDVTP